MASFLSACPGVSVWVRHWRWGWRCRPGSRVDTAGLDLISLPQPPKYRDYKYVPRLAPVTFLEGDSEVFCDYCSGWAILFSPLFCCLRICCACMCAHSDRDLHGKNRFSPSITWVPDGAHVVPLHRHADTPVFSLNLLLPL